MILVNQGIGFSIQQNMENWRAHDISYQALTFEVVGKE